MDWWMIYSQYSYSHANYIKVIKWYNLNYKRISRSIIYVAIISLKLFYRKYCFNFPLQLISKYNISSWNLSTCYSDATPRFAGKNQMESTKTEFRVIYWIVKLYKQEEVPEWFISSCQIFHYRGKHDIIKSVQALFFFLSTSNLKIHPS